VFKEPGPSAPRSHSKYKRLNMLNRSIAIIKIKEPFLDWVKSLPTSNGKITLAEINFNNTNYLLPEYDNDEEKEEIIFHYFDMIFERQLQEWGTILPERWPKTRDFKTFKEWFDIEFHPVEDLVDAPLRDG